jgi:hypothetical protein
LKVLGSDANEFDMEGHAAKAKAANRELRAAPTLANKNAK